MQATLPKEERLSGRNAISSLLGGGKWHREECIRCCVKDGNGLEFNRIIVSVPKRSFKRAVKRNLLKRRIREAYRRQKDLLPGGGRDILFVYSGAELASYEAVYAQIGSLLRKIAA